jgi:hypothetical protein
MAEGIHHPCQRAARIGNMPKVTIFALEIPLEICAPYPSTLSLLFLSLDQVNYFWRYQNLFKSRHDLNLKKAPTSILPQHHIHLKTRM